MEVRKKEKEEKEEKKKVIKKEFKALLKETESIDRHSHWSDVKKTIGEDPRYASVESSGQREDWFYDYMQELKDEHRKEKDKKKAEKEKVSRSRSKSRGRKRSRSRSRSGGKEKKKRDKSKEKKKKKDKDRSRSRDKKKRVKKEKEEGEMSGDDGEIVSGSEISRRESKEEEEDKTNGASEATEDAGGEIVGEEKRMADEQKEKEERVAASLRKREEEVKANLAGHLRERDKEREQHQHMEAVNGFAALLTDLIRAPDFTWKEAKKILKKDSRWEAVSNLDKSERERLFDEHIDHLMAKKKESYRSLLDEQKDVALDATFKDIKKNIREDPRYTKFSSSDKKCEKEFSNWMRDKQDIAREEYKQLLMETKLITHKSLQMIKDKEGNHMEEIEEVLCKDSRYHVLEPLNDDRADILMSYLQELEKRGPPPPPTASEPNRRK